VTTDRNILLTALYVKIDDYPEASGPDRETTEAL